MMTPLEEILEQIDGSKYVGYDNDTEILYVWGGGQFIRVLSALTGEKFDAIKIDSDAIMPQLGSALIAITNYKREVRILAAAIEAECDSEEFDEIYDQIPAP